MNRLHLGVVLLLLFLVSCSSVPSPEVVVATATPTQTAIPARTPEPTATPTSAPTSTPLPTYTLSGIVFFDYNGNGVRDEGEPPIEGTEITVQGIRAPSSQECTDTTDAAGVYRCKSIPEGKYAIRIVGPNAEDPVQAFRYISTFRGWVDIPEQVIEGTTVPAQHLADAGFHPVENGIEISVEGETVQDIGLMQGFLTLPIPCNEDFSIGTYYDHRVGPGSENWMGNSDITGDEHIGIDYRCPAGTPIVSAAPGEVEEIIWREGETGGYTVVVGHGNSSDGSIEYDTDYAHLQEVRVAVGDRVERGQLLGLSGAWGSYPHLHFGFFAFRREPSGQAVPLDGERDINVDPYRHDVAESGVSYWTVDNDPQCPPSEE